MSSDDASLTGQAPQAELAPHIVIAGAGIGGLTAALCLARSGFRVSLFERAAAFEEVGAGLQISPNASAILRDLGVLPRVTGALAPQALNIRRAGDGATLQRVPFKDAERRWGAPYLLNHRADLQRALVETVTQNDAITVTTGCELTGVETTDKGLTIGLRGGAGATTVDADCLIGADGLRSYVRRKLGEMLRGQTAWPAMPNKARHVAWRTLINAREVTPALRAPESTLWLGPKAHIIHYPLRDASVINVVAVVETDLAIDWAADLWSQKGDATAIQRRFADWHRDVRGLIGAATDWRHWPLVDLESLPQWSAGRIALLGDAAHPMLPFLAQGAAQAIEDAAMLGAMLSPRQPIEPCLAAYAAARRPRANRIQTASRRQGAIYHLGAPANFLRDLALRGLGESAFLTRYDWLYRQRPTVA